jgi:hypothetical protein
MRGFGGKGTGLLHDFAYVGIAFLLTGPLGRHRWAFGRRLGVGLRPELVQAFLDRGQVGLQTFKCGTSRIGKRIDLLAQGLEFCRRQIVACEAFPYLRQGSLMLAEVFCVDGRAGLFGFGGKGTACFTTSLMSV